MRICIWTPPQVVSFKFIPKFRNNLCSNRLDVNIVGAINFLLHNPCSNLPKKLKEQGLAWSKPSCFLVI